MTTSEYVAEFLSGLTERKFVELMHAVLKARSEDQIFEGGEYQYDRWCLALSSYGVFEGIAEAPRIELVGQCAPEVAHVDWDSLCQQGQCTVCKSLVVSVAKLALCPVCSCKVERT